MNDSMPMLNTYIILFRGVNVGGKNRLPMKDFKARLMGLGYQGVSSYINSGNIVLESQDDPANRLRQLVADEYGFAPEIFCLTQSELAQAISNCPFTDKDAKLVHFYFCKQPIQLNTEKANKFIASSERYHVNDNVFYLHAPDGIGRSRLVANLESCLGQPATGRNLNTINKLSQMTANC